MQEASERLGQLTRPEDPGVRPYALFRCAIPPRCSAVAFRLCCR